MFKLIIRVDLRTESLALERIVKESAAFVSCADDTESVADHFRAVALEGGCVLAAFTAFYAFVGICGGMRNSVVTMLFTAGKCGAALMLKIFLEDLISALLRYEGEEINDKEKNEDCKCKKLDARIKYKGRYEAEALKGGKGIFDADHVIIVAEKSV